MPGRSRKRRPADLDSLAASTVADATDDEDRPELLDDGKAPVVKAV